MINFTLLKDEVAQLLQSPLGMREGMERIRQRLQKHGRGLTAIFDRLSIEAEYEQFAEWLQNLLVTEPLPPEVRAVHFGLLESPHGVDLYLTGTSEWQPESLKWRGNNCYVPAKKYSPTNLFTGIVKQFGTNAHIWMYLSLGLIILFVQRFVAEGRDLFFWNGTDHLFCTTGFDEGDLFIIGEMVPGGFIMG